MPQTWEESDPKYINNQQVFARESSLLAANAVNVLRMHAGNVVSDVAPARGYLRHRDSVAGATRRNTDASCACLCACICDLLVRTQCLGVLDAYVRVSSACILVRMCPCAIHCQRARARARALSLCVLDTCTVVALAASVCGADAELGATGGEIAKLFDQGAQGGRNGGLQGR